MLFNSIEFLVFIVVVLIGHFALIPRRLPRLRKGFLLLASYAFYMAWNPPFGLLLLFSTVLDFSVTQWMEGTTPARRKALLGLSLLGNLGVLGFFKYRGFVLETLSVLWGTELWGVQQPDLDLVLPVGISFYTFQTLSYSIDVYRGSQRASRSFLDFALYVSFFPQLVAGPIVRSGVFLPQLRRVSRVTSDDLEAGLSRIGSGLVKKVVFADVLGGYVDPVFSAPSAFGGLNLLLAAYAYAFQIYFDFSGYSDIAIGLARLFGYRIPENFDRPYLAASPRELWRRWHISLSTWLRDYLYVSLGGNRVPPLRIQLNLVITMLLGGLWHGASWNFVLWGGFHGLLLLLQRAGTRLLGPSRVAGLPTWLCRLLTFHLVCIGWVLFRSPDWATARAVYEGLWSGHFAWSVAALQALLVLACAAGIELLAPARALSTRLRRSPGWAQGLGYTGIAVLVLLFSSATQRFIYFQF